MSRAQRLARILAVARRYRLDSFIDRQRLTPWQRGVLSLATWPRAAKARPWCRPFTRPCSAATTAAPC